MSLHGSAAMLSGEVYAQVRVPAVAFQAVAVSCSRSHLRRLRDRPRLPRG